MRSFVARYPMVFAVLVALSAFGLDSLSRARLPSRPIASAGDLSPAALEPPSEAERVVSTLQGSESVYWVLVAVLALALTAGLGWWRETGLVGRPRWRNLRLAWFPVLVLALALPGGLRVTSWGFLVSVLLGSFLVAVGEEMLFRGVVLRALSWRGVRMAVATTAVLSGAVWLARSWVAGPGPEAVLLTALAVGGGFAYGALRWRTASVWPGVSLHFALGSVSILAAPPAGLYLAFLFLGTFGSVAYGLFLLRNPHVRADGG